MARDTARLVTFKSLKYLGSVEIKKSIHHLVSSSDRSSIVSYAIKKILQRYGRTNFFNKPVTSDVDFDEFIGRSPMSNWNDTHCTIEITEDSILVSVEENNLSAMLFHHSINCISVATIDLFLPNLYCYVANQDAHQRQKVKSEQQDRRLYLFECTDLLQTRKLIDETKKRFRQAPKQSPIRTQAQKHVVHRVKLQPETVTNLTMPSPTIPPRIERHGTVNKQSMLPPPPPPPKLPHYLNPN